MKTRLQSIADVICEAVINGGQSTLDAAHKAGISHGRLSLLMQRDRGITYRTAGKLRAAFGDNAVRLLPTKGAD